MAEAEVGFGRGGEEFESVSESGAYTFLGGDSDSGEREGGEREGDIIVGSEEVASEVALDAAPHVVRGMGVDGTRDSLLAGSGCGSWIWTGTGRDSGTSGTPRRVDAETEARTGIKKRWRSLIVVDAEVFWLIFKESGNTPEFQEGEHRPGEHRMKQGEHPHCGGDGEMEGEREARVLLNACHSALQLMRSRKYGASLEVLDLAWGRLEEGEGPEPSTSIEPCHAGSGNEAKKTTHGNRGGDRQATGVYAVEEAEAFRDAWGPSLIDFNMLDNMSVG
ncbi:hypothetical protein B0H17DRAFT_1141451 [Mycena rosella]|uniref:Uncharacterized protein n=1 Tax=Mycena rosella TaxID=1033263 RepID=A0AAD7GA59_MYCRO|nr:hypothetical protein B0H17DRAFT_1141451 [Mycena rosella]